MNFLSPMSGMRAKLVLRLPPTLRTPQRGMTFLRNGRDNVLPQGLILIDPGTVQAQFCVSDQLKAPLRSS
ncbi:hypothetical protein GFGA_1d1291 [Gluconobacter frateurii NBRC 103465]|nr:hypothetical protein GFGA_1d1291 [Gluconobacter frateurii NBRC 103465]